MPDHDDPGRHLGARHHVAGGLEHGGGIGRLVGYIRDAGGARAHRVTDTRGPRWSPLTSPARLGLAMAAIALDRVTRPRRIQQLHIAGRGSTARKLILGATARALGSPYVLHLHDPDYADDLARRSPGQRRRVARLFQGAARVIVLGRRDALTVAAMGVPGNRISVLHNAVPDPGPRSTERSDPEVEILFLGQLGPRKGVPELLDALAGPRLAGLPWRAVLGGDGDVAGYRARAHDLGLGDRVRLTGWLAAPDAAALLRTSDILVLPSHGEGMAMSVLEGLAHGLAVVTTPVGSHAEVLIDGETCRFVTPGDAAGLAQALAELIEDDELRDRLGAAGRALHERQLGLAVYMRRLEAILAEIRDGPHGAHLAPGHRA